MRKFILLLTFVILSYSLCAETIAQQSFEGLATDTWVYSSNPAPNRLIYWGPTSEAMGGASAQEGTVYWAGWDLDNQDYSLTFPALSLPLGFSYTLTFWYYTKNLDPVSDFCRYSLKYDNGSTWDNWVTVNNNTNAWTSVSVALPPGSPYLRLRLSSSFDGITKYAHWDHLTVEKSPTPIAEPLVYNVVVNQRTDGSKLVDIYYDLFDANNDLCEISFELSSDNGVLYTVLPTSGFVTGDFGANISSGTGKHIVWDAGAESFSLGGSYLYRVSADDGITPIPERFILVEGGTFNNGVSAITLSSFYIDQYELTQAEYQAVMGSNPASGNGVGGTYPVYSVSWFNAIEYSNRRSMQEGLTPCYSYLTYGTNPNTWPSWWSTTEANHTNVSCNWSANGYRLPTEMEWMFAARGGNQTNNYTYSGSNDLNAVGWYNDNSGYSTHIVGTKAANELGTYDMSGNVTEWVWDIHGSYPIYSQYNPTGAISGSYRMGRGGCRGSSADNCTVLFRYAGPATGTGDYMGFRLCRSLENFVLIEGGTFNNGTSGVTVSSFYIDKFEITQAGYQAVMGVNPSYFTGISNKPVERITWFKALEYCNRRSLQEGLTPCYSYSTYGTNPDTWPVGWNTSNTNHTYVSCNWTANGYRLPTEMEWMFAARGGNQTHDYAYSGSSDINTVGWYNVNSGGVTHIVGTLNPNELGIYDMTGNVLEWTWDIYSEYSSEPQTNPQGAPNGDYRVHRGGYYQESISICNLSYRYYNTPTYFFNGTGIRVVRISP